MGAFFSGGKGWITEPRRFSAWFGCPPQAAAFAKLLPTGFRRRKAGSEPPPPYNRHQKGACLRVVGRGGSPNHCALARGSAVRRRRQLSRSCRHLAFEDEKPEANLHPIYGRQSDVRFSVVGRGGLTNHGPKRAWFGCPPEAAAFAKLLPSRFRRRKAGSEPPPPYKRHQIYGAGFLR